MEKATKFLPLILGGIVAIFVFFVSRKIQKANQTNDERDIVDYKIYFRKF